MSFITLANGIKMPLVGLGTFQSKPGEVETAVEAAIDGGYRHFDTAAVYENEKEIGSAIQKKISEAKVTREDLFITTKLSPFYHTRERVKQNLQESLQKLGLTYVDLYLIHFPCSSGSYVGSAFNLMFRFIKPGLIKSEVVDYVETWKGMEDIYKAGLAKAIGVSNFNAKQIERLLENAETKPHNLQVEANVHFHQQQLYEICKKSGISLTAYAPLGSPGPKMTGVSQSNNSVSVLEDPTVKAVAEAHKKSPAQVALRYLMQRKICVIPKSVSAGRIKSNFDLFDFKLTDEEINKLANIPDQERVYPLNWLRGNPHYPF